MIKSKPATVSADRLKSFLERYEKLGEERDAVSGDMRDILTEAKSAGYDAPTIRWLVKERKVDVTERDERDRLRDTYALALGMAVNLVEVGGLSLRKAAKATGLSKSSIHRALSVPKPSQQAGSETGTSSEQEALAGGDVVGIPATADMGIPMSGKSAADVEPETHSNAPPLPEEANTDDQPAPCGSSVSSSGPAFQGDQLLPTPSVGAVAEGDSPQRVATDEIDLTPPSRLLAKRREIEERRSASQ